MNQSASGQTLFPLYRDSYEHDSCGVGLVVSIEGEPSRHIVDLALGGLVNLTHRGGVGADERTGDGAGILTQLPHALFAPVLTGFGSHAGPGDYGVATAFLPVEAERAAAARTLLENAATGSGIPILGWREVPVDASVLGHIAAKTRPAIWQFFLGRPNDRNEQEFERQLMLLRKAIERAAANAGFDDLYIASCSCRTIVYKGFCLPDDLAVFYRDLQDPAFASAIALFHQRYSTNTLPTWSMAQPFRFIAHNGEINTVQGNRTWMIARTPDLSYDDGVDASLLAPVVNTTGSDSASFDNVIELLYHGNRSLPHALMMLVPEPWEQSTGMPADLRAFYDVHAGLMEQWDGPAALAFSDGVLAGAALDRNGLRPMRYAITSDGLFIAGSEAGTVAVDQCTVIEKGRLGPGQMVIVDTSRQIVLRNAEIKAEIAREEPWQERLAAHRVRLAEEFECLGQSAIDDLATVQRSYGYSGEDGRLIVGPMAGEGKEPTWSMGDDAPLAVLSERIRPLTAYFRQRFAQVTNPPIDSLREKKVMALDSYIGPRGNLLAGKAGAADLIHLPGVIVSESQIERLATIEEGTLHGARVSTLFPVPGPDIPDGAALTAALDQFVETAISLVDAGASVLVLTDRATSRDQVAIPMLLAVGALHHETIRRGMRMRFDIVCETGEVWDVHQLACLIGYSAAAVHPWLALRAASALAGTRGYENATESELQKNYVHMLEYGMLKVASKMGISTISGYRGAQIFETIGLSQALVDRYFTGTPARLGGIGLAEIERDLLARHREAYAESTGKLPDPGFIRFRKDGEAHAYNPTVVKALQAAVESNRPADYAAYRDLVRAHPLTAVRDLMTIEPLREPIPIAEVEPARAIAARFVVTAMSLGALSPEAFRALAIGMNRAGGRSNSGEGGEDPAWYDEPGPDQAHSKIKQVASGRFGVTARYLAMASELEIKMAQGSKPGEGGQLPGHKVTEFVARVRHAVPGLPLISPPPHHDIYSIEDLAQLIFDLRQVNPRARIGVKLVAEAGVGTIAAGVAKARADYILISGHSGGTGASPLTSIKYAGCPWELGLAETQQTLVMNGLRSRVRLRADGGIKTPDDVILATMLGAEEYGFGTSVLIALGCNMARQCHLNTCPTGIATQKEELRAKFSGKPGMVASYFTLLAEGVREVMASLGIRSLDEIVGRTDLLARRSDLPGRAGLLDLDAFFAQPAAESERRQTTRVGREPATIDDRILAEHGEAIRGSGAVSVDLPISTRDRTVGGRIAGTIALAHGLSLAGAPKYRAVFTGSAGQSFGAFTVDGMELTLQGEANDYVGKGMAGGTIVIRPLTTAAFDTPQVIAGNTILYGATGGEVYIAGKAGERFAVRNSGATAVVEGTGDHGCEYMTGGLVAVLGPTGRNFGAGMTNGVAYVYDPDGVFDTRINGESVLIERGLAPESERELRRLIERHVTMTGSTHGRSLLDRWDATLAATWRVIPRATLLRQAAPPEQTAVRGAAD